ncbi:hypothetical protein ACFQS1_04905 [Paractinoplanes rhizophilus]|uniref:Uncharacterized protein n=1 Tax=Paractinoplanes rhizophilus TaxID=1416877 RepID=A0ABW2HMP7_9ACTN
MADLTALREIPAARARLDAAELELIDQARRDGATWADIASALGLGSRQAAEQRRLRLASAVHPVRPDVPYGPEIAALRAAAVDLYRRVGADRRWDTRFRRAPLVRQTLSFAADAPLSGLYSLVADVMADLAEAGLHGAGLSRADLSEARVTLPRPTRSCVERLAAALEAATPR